MPYYAVESGNIFRCVLADDRVSACVNAVALHCNDGYREECKPGSIFMVAQLGESAKDNVFIGSETIRKAGGFQVEQAEGEDSGEF